MDFPRLRSISASLPTPPLVERLRRKRERWLTTMRVRSGPGWVGLNAALSFAAQRATRWARFPALMRGDMAAPWDATSVENFLPVRYPSYLSLGGGSPEILEPREGARQPSPPLPVGHTLALMQRPSEHFLPRPLPSSLPVTRLFTVPIGPREGGGQPVPPFPVGHIPPLMQRPSKGRSTGDAASLLSGPARMITTRGLDRPQTTRGQGIPLAGPMPLLTIRAGLFGGRGYSSDPRGQHEAEPMQERMLLSPMTLGLASLRRPLQTTRSPDTPAAAPTPLPPTALRFTAGAPLAPMWRARLEPLLGFDLGGVRLHTDSAAASLAFRLRAHAFTVGPHIFFAAGRFQPQTRPGLALLAHELAHVSQQPEGAPWLWGRLTPTAHRSLEQEAHARAHAVLARTAHPGFGVRVPRQLPVSRTTEDISEVVAVPSDGGMALPPLVLSYASRALAVVPLRQEMTADVPEAPVAPTTTRPAATPTSPASEAPDPEQVAQQVYEWIQRRQRIERERRGIQQWH
jgi:hypothetical protein